MFKKKNKYYKVSNSIISLDGIIDVTIIGEDRSLLSIRYFHTDFIVQLKQPTALEAKNVLSDISRLLIS
jgi:hypothetical protein